MHLVGGPTLVATLQRSYRLKEHSATTDIPVIILTGRTIGNRPDHPLERTLLSLGATAYLTKPLDFSALLTELGRHVVLRKPDVQAAPL